jgi:hypothetical protein
MRSILGRNSAFQYATSSEDEIINDKNINTVAILTRHDSHADLVVKALKAGKHVFVEKPLAINSGQLSVISKQLAKTDNCLAAHWFQPSLCSLNPKSEIANRKSKRTSCMRIIVSMLVLSLRIIGRKTQPSAVDASSAKRVTSLTC